ncbi:rRNA methyltransferase [Moraxella osloensis]|uniref:tRNA (cytidine/uridine-2'-O-)-methyltransferase TrmJ n=1 Tax=Faucicola osloensis TaxID=34062 RepID=A0AA91FPD6_FAUOS|nr:TrmJ/YjtD family RNA methyltransferase [Moraxella osloensis]OBX62525.1 rRNA methyltransferase [Moraxella osloensis]
MVTTDTNASQQPFSTLAAFLAGIRIVMVNTTLPANVGSAARAMHTMGLTQLTVVAPKLPIDEDAYAHAAGAKAILDAVTICDTLEQALQDCHWVIATSSRQRHIPRPVLSPRQAAELMVTNFQNLSDVMTDAAHPNWQLAIVFGREDRGLTNEELQLADYHIQIPANAEYGVLNVAAAVQVITSVFYETAELALTAKTAAEKSIDLTFRQQWDEPPISNEQRLQLENRLLSLLENLAIYNPAQSKVMPQRINRLLSRLQLDIKEYQLLQATIAKLLKS